MDDFLRLPLDEAVDLARLLLTYATNSEVVFEKIEVLLNACIIHTEAPESVFRSVAALIRDLSSTHPNLARVLLTFLPSIPVPLPFIEIVPTLFAMTAPEVVAEAVEQLHTMLKADNRLLIPVMAAMTDLPLPLYCIQLLSSIAENAVAIVDDDDLPLLFRTLVKCLDQINSPSLSIKLRHEISAIPLSSVVLVIEVLWETLPNSLKAAECLLHNIQHDIGRVAVPCVSDVAVVLILTCTGGLQAARATTVMEAWLISGRFPFLTLETIVSLKRANEVWDRMGPAIWSQCLWILERISPACFSKYNLTTHFKTIVQGLSKLIIQIFQTSHHYRETIVASLLKYCFARESSLVSDAVGLRSYPILGQAAEPSHSDNSAHALLFNYSNLKGEASALILADLMKQCPDVGCQIFNSFLTNLNPASDGALVLPTLTILHKVMICIMEAIPRSPQIESTLLIIIQKYLSSVTLTSESQSLIRILAPRKRLTCSYYSQINKPHSNEHATNRITYNQTCIGLLLATHLLRSKCHSVGLHLDSEAEALVRWTCRSLRGCQDYSLFYALDMLAAFLAADKHSSSSSSSSSHCSSSRDSITILVTSAFDEFFECTDIVRASVVDGGHQTSRTVSSPSPATVCLHLTGMYAHDSEKDTTASSPCRHSSWQIGRIAAAIVKDLDRGEMDGVGSRDHSLRVSTAISAYGCFWIIFKLSVSISLLAIDADSSGSASTSNFVLITKNHDELDNVEGAMKSSRSRSSDKRRSKTKDLAVDYGFTRLVYEVEDAAKEFSQLKNELWIWSCSAAGMFSKTAQKHNLVLPLTESLRFAWERSLVSIVLLGEMQVHGLRVHANELLLSIITLSKFFCQISWARQLLRVSASTMKVKVLTNTKENVRRTGCGSRRSSMASGGMNRSKSNVGAKRKERVGHETAAEQQTASFETHISCLQTSLSRACRLIPLEILINSCTGILSEDSVSSTLDSPTLYKRRLNLLATDFGLVLMAGIAQRLLLDNCSDFFHFNESYEASMSRLFVELETGLADGSTDDVETDTVLWDCIVNLASFIPGTLELSHQRRLEDMHSFPPASTTHFIKTLNFANNAVNSFHGALVPYLGSALDREGCDFLVIMFFILLEHKVEKTRITKCMTYELSEDPCIQSICHNYSSSFSLQPSTPSINPSISSVPVTFQSPLVNTIHSSDEGLSRLYISVELEVLKTRNFTVAISGYRLLRSIAKGTLLSPRLAALSWTLCSLLFTEQIDFYEECASGSDELSGYMDNICSTIPQEVEDGMKHLQGRQRGRLAYALLKPYEKLRSSLSPTGNAKKTFQNFQTFWLVWWSAEYQEAYRGVGVILTDLMATLMFTRTNPSSSCRSKKVKEAINRVESVFPQFQLETLDYYFNLIMSTLPAIVHQIHPTIPTADETMADDATPYQGLIHAVQTFMWCLCQLEKLIDEGMFVSFILKTSAVTIKACRAILEAILMALDCCIDWRNTQEIDLVTDDPMRRDWGSASYLLSAIEWSLRCGKVIERYGMLFKEKVTLPGELDVPGAVIRLIPALQNDVASFNLKLFRISKAHKIGKSHFPGTNDAPFVALMANSAGYRARFEVILVLYQNILNAPVSSVLLGPAEENTRNAFDGLWKAHSSHATNDSIMHGGKTSFDVFFDSKEEGEEFAVQTSNSTGSGWGIYSYEGEEDGEGVGGYTDSGKKTEGYKVHHQDEEDLDEDDDDDIDEDSDDEYSSDFDEE